MKEMGYRLILAVLIGVAVYYGVVNTMDNTAAYVFLTIGILMFLLIRPSRETNTISSIRFAGLWGAIWAAVSLIKNSRK